MSRIKSILQPSKKKIVILLVLITAAFVAFNFFNKPSKQALQFASVKRQDIKAEVSSSGTLTGKAVANLKFKSAGKLAYINIKPGDKVSEGQLIASLDTQDLAIKLQQAQNTYKDKQATAQKIEDDVKDHALDETFTQKALRTTAQAARDSAYDAVKEAQRAFGDAVIISPISGLITQAFSTPGQNVGTSDLIAQVVDFSFLKFDTDIDESDIGKVSVGQKAEVSLDAFPDKIFEGSVSEIIPQTRVTSSGATVVTVKITLGDLTISPVNGLSGQAAIILSENKNALTIPLEALREDDSVIIPQGKSLRSQKVVSGIKSDTDVEIKEGLKEGDRILLNPPSNISGGR